MLGIKLDRNLSRRAQKVFPQISNILHRLGNGLHIAHGVSTFSNGVAVQTECSAENKGSYQQSCKRLKRHKPIQTSDGVLLTLMFRDFPANNSGMWRKGNTRKQMKSEHNRGMGKNSGLEADVRLLRRSS